MNIRSKTRVLVPLLALSMTIATVAVANADHRKYERSGGTDASLQITFGSKPHWDSVPGTSVREIRQSDRSDYDMFRYGHSYYAYNSANDRWYTSRGWQGQFVMIDDRSVPRDLRRVPRDRWQNYPTSWEARNSDRRSRDDNYRSDGTSARFQVSFGSSPHWMGVSGTRVEMVPMAERPNYDVFRYGGNYYAYNSNRWYSSPRESGQFTMIDDRSVPMELSRVPRDQWRNYPSTWEAQGNNDQGSNGTSAMLQVSFGSTPHWMGVSGTRVEMVPMAERPNYDVFRYGGNYYVYNSSRWYTSPRESGQFTMIDDRAVPTELSRVPRDQWRNYPSTWDNNNDQRGRGGN